MNPLVSVVIPVYNAEKYLDNGVNSLHRQTYKNIEIILVDDLSTDGSWKICTDLAKKSKKVKAFQNKKNSGGPLRGRELGIKQATGQWITFMDCDDFVEPDYIHNLISATDNGKYDIAVTGYQKYFDDGSKEPFMWDDYSQTTEERLVTFYRHFLTHNFWTDPTDTVGQNLVRAEVAKKTDLSIYSSDIWAEDTLMALAFLSNTKNGVNFVNKHDFNWRQVKGSGSHGGFSSRADKDGFFRACEAIFHDEYREISTELPLISVIIPVYNVEVFLDECLRSVLGQTYRNIEVICVNDGSLDGSEAIIDRFVEKDHRVLKVSKKNQGLNAARESGYKASCGEYITFVDSDDTISQNYARDLYESLTKNGVDIATGGYATFISSNDIKRNASPDKITSVAETSDIAVEWLLTGNLKNEIIGSSEVLRMTAWSKLYKRSIIESTDWEFSNYQTNEDELETLQWFSCAKNGVSVITNPIYNYRINPDSKTQKKYSNKSPDGRLLNKLDFSYEWMKKAKTYLNSPAYDGKIMQRFMWLVQDQVVRSFEEGTLQSEISVIASFIEKIQADRDEEISKKQETLTGLLDSKSWTYTAPLRSILGVSIIRIPLRIIYRISRFIRHPRQSARKIKSRISDYFTYLKYKNAWIITDRFDEAADNGILFYDYISKNHPEVNAYYVLSKNSLDFNRLKEKGVRLVDHGSIDHSRLAKYADVEVSAFFNFAPFDMSSIGRKKPIKRAFILHGMDQSDLSQHYYRLRMDLYGVVTEVSLDFYKLGKSLIDISDKNLQLTGMPRYDLIREKLKASRKNSRTKIVIAPTWRRFLLYKPGTVEKQDEQYLIKSDYYKYYTNIFNSLELRKLSKKYEIVLIPHPEMLNRIKEFKIPDYMKIKTYRELGTSNLYDLALTTKLFISDFSSTVFDFAFLGANIAHFNFDSEDYYSDKQELYKSWFDIDHDGFGPSFKDVESLKLHLNEQQWVRYQDNIDIVWNQIPEHSSELIYANIKNLLRNS